MQNNQRNTKSNQNYNAFKDTSIDSMNNSYIINNHLGTIEEKYYKYKNLENPFTIPDMPKNAAKERRTRIINRINKERMNYHSKSVDNTIYKNTNSDYKEMGLLRKKSNLLSFLYKKPKGK